jgi:hypothetical protein
VVSVTDPYGRILGFLERPKHELRINILNEEETREHQPKLQIDGNSVPKVEFAQCNRMLQYSSTNNGVAEMLSFQNFV